MAELSKRENKFDDARRLYRKVTKLQPYACSGWLEYAKLEEECGDLARCDQVLRRGLIYCEHSEALMIRAIKHHERLGNVPAARTLLSRLKHVGIEKVWRTMLEGALMEDRAGNTDIARTVLSYCNVCGCCAHKLVMALTRTSNSMKLHCGCMQEDQTDFSALHA
eukprot:12348-Heterococcus_DN1.PRE.1